jgi:cytochrome P450
MDEAAQLIFQVFAVYLGILSVEAPSTLDQKNGHMPDTNESMSPSPIPKGRRLPPSATRGSLRPLVRDPLRFFQKLTAEYGDIVCYRPAPDTAYLINHPDYVRHVLVDNNRNYSKETSSNQIFNKVVAEGLLTSEGETWRKQRRLMQPAFHHTRLELLDTMIGEATQAMLDRWRQLQRENQPVDVAREMAALTLSVTTRALFGVNLGEEVREIGEVVNRSIGLLEKPSDPRLQQSVTQLNEVVDRIIRKRRVNFNDGGDLLSSMMLARDAATGEGMSDQQLRDQIMTLMLAGYDTTASALTWTWYLLSQNPEAGERLRQEVRETLDGRTPRYEDLEKLPYTRRVLNESLRLYPPAWTLGRRALGEDEMGGYYIAPGSVIAICVYAIHRHPGYWEKPDAFDPDRFLPENSAGRHKFAYVPFGAGPRQCIGNNFGLMEASLIIAGIARQFDLRLMPGVDAQPQAVFVLRPGRDLMMSLHS